MAIIKYGDVFQLQNWESKGYLALDSSGAVVTTESGVGTWKFQSASNKTGEVDAGDTVYLVYAGPSSVHSSPSYLKGGATSPSALVASISAEANLDTNDPGFKWDIYGWSSGKRDEVNSSGPVTDDVYITLSCSVTPTNGTGKSSNGAFLNVNTDKPARGTIDGEKEIHTVGTRYPLSYGTGPTVWWKPVLVTSSPAPSPSPDNGSNSLCDELPNIMKSICSLTVLMHKVVDACYPPSSWPTQPYPDGCSAHGHKHKGCGCNGQSKN